MKRNERGFTLIEVIVAMVIGVVVITAMTQAFDQGLSTLNVAEGRIAGSNDTQLISDYFNRDVASSEYASVIGTRFHSAPATTASSPNSLLLSLFTLARATTATPPDGMAEQWDLASTGPDPAKSVTVDADDDLVPQGPVTDRVLETADGTFSIDHSIVIAPAGGNAISRRAVAAASTPGATALTLAKPTGTQAGDVLIAQVGVRGGTSATVAAPAGWTLLDAKDAGATIKSAAYSHTVTLLDPASWTWTFNGAREAAGGIGAYAGAGSVTAHTVDVSPCGGNPPLLLMSWTDRGTGQANEVTYNLVTSDGYNTLVRKHCINNKGLVVDQQTLARNLVATDGGVAVCQPVACGPLSDSRVIITLTLTELPAPHKTVGRVYQIRGSTRTNA
jgi:prepilin-type N-terminal cleavage/methylation domain-containing protein